MKISYNWLKDYIQTSLSPEEMGKILTQTGLEVEGIEKVESIPGGLQGLVVGEVISKSKHANADRLNVTQVDIGSGDLIQIVCGAPNVDSGQKVIVATVGTTLFPLEGDSFKIKKGKIRGEESNGMICAEDEIGIGKSHEGIIVLESDTKIGVQAAEVFDLTDDYCIEIGLTPNRTDGMSHIGVARDLVAALKNMEGIENDPKAKTIWPDLNTFKTDNTDLSIDVSVENQDSCPRYCGLTFTNVKVADSPKWLTNKLISIGLKPINNVVDITNYVLHEYGQPLHAFDAAQIKDNKVIVKNLKENTTFTTLDEVERKLDAEDLIICNGDSDDSKSAMCIAGVFGGISSGVTEETTTVFLESAYFHPVAVRKTAKRHGLSTDASFRFERGVDPNITIDALKRAALLIKEICGATISSEIIDLYPEPIEDFKVELKWKNVNRLIGIEIPQNKIKAILSDLDIQVESESDSGVLLSVAPYRADVKREADIIEEIIRIYGFNNVEAPAKMKSSLSYRPSPDREYIQHLTGDLLSNRGFLEMMSNSLTKEAYHEDFNSNKVDKDHNVAILNPLSRELNVMRQSLLFGGLEAIEKNKNHKNENLALYEFGKEYRKSGDKYIESNRLAIFLHGKKGSESWNDNLDDYTFFDLKATVESIIQRLGIWNNPVNDVLDNELLEDGIIIKIQNKPVATIGWVKSKISKKFDLESRVWYAELNWDTILDIVKHAKVKFKAIGKFPSMRRDLSLLVNESTTFDQIHKIAAKVDKKILKDIGLFDVYEGKNLEEGKKSYAVSFAFEDENKTLTDKEVDKIMSKIQNSLEQQIGARLR